MICCCIAHCTYNCTFMSDCLKGSPLQCQGCKGGDGAPNRAESALRACISSVCICRCISRPAPGPPPPPTTPMVQPDMLPGKTCYSLSLHNYKWEMLNKWYQFLGGTELRCDWRHFSIYLKVWECERSICSYNTGASLGSAPCNTMNSLNTAGLGIFLAGILPLLLCLF